MEPEKNIETLRALSTTQIKREIRSFEDTLQYAVEQAKKIADDATDKGGGNATTNKKLQKIMVLVSDTIQTTSHLRDRVDEHENGFRTLRLGLLTELKREYINVPGSVSEKKRAAILPSDMGKVKRKRRNAATGAKKRKSRKKKKLAAVAAASAAAAASTADGSVSNKATAKKSRRRTRVQKETESVILDDGNAPPIRKKMKIKMEKPWEGRREREKERKKG